MGTLFLYSKENYDEMDGTIGYMTMKYIKDRKYIMQT